MRDHEVGPVALGDVEHLGAHLDAGRRHRKGPQLELLDLLQILEDRQRLAAGRIVVEDISDLLAREISAQLLLDELDRGGALRPVRGGDREDVRVACSVGRGRGTEARRGAGDTVFGQFLRQRLDLRRAVDHDRDRTVTLEEFVALHRRRDLVLVVDLARDDLVSLDPALRVDQVHVVLNGGTQVDAHDLRRTGAVALVAYQHLLLLRPRRTGEPQPDGGSRRQDRTRGRYAPHVCSPPVFSCLNTRTATSGSNCGCCPTAG